jgi:hypothetical protein
MPASAMRSTRRRRGLSAIAAAAAWCYAAALRLVCRPSAISSMIFAEKASRSPGWREVITPWSTTTGESSQLAPALITSVLIER